MIGEATKTHRIFLQIFSEFFGTLVVMMPASHPHDALESPKKLIQLFPLFTRFSPHAVRSPLENPRQSLAPPSPFGNIPQQPGCRACTHTPCITVLHMHPYSTASLYLNPSAYAIEQESEHRRTLRASCAIFYARVYVVSRKSHGMESVWILRKMMQEKERGSSLAQTLPTLHNHAHVTE